MDIVDHCFEEQESYIQRCIDNVRKRPERKLVPFGICYYCSEEVIGNKLFCDSECAEEYEKNKAR